MNGYQEGDTTPIEDEENIRRHHTRDTVEKQFNETYCYLLKGVASMKNRLGIDGSFAEAVYEPSVEESPRRCHCRVPQSLQVSDQILWQVFVDS